MNGRHHLRTYVEGQLGPLERKSIEPIADAAGIPPRSLQEFLSLLRWDEDAVRDRIQHIVARKHRGEENVGIVDETSFHKQGNMTACVQRQYCGATGKIDNCVVSVHLAFSNETGFHTLIDSTLYLPEDSWHRNRARCRAAAIAKEVVYRPLHEIALEQIRHATANGVPLEWICADERYGMVPAFLDGVEKEGLFYVVEVPKGLTGWTQCPEVWPDREHAPPESQGLRAFPRLAEDAPSAKTIEEIARHSYAIRQQPWVAFHLKETLKGPEVWEVKSCAFFHHRDGRASGPLRLIVARHVLDGTTKFFLAHAPADASIQTLLRVGFTRWRVERCFEDEKGRIGMDHFEVRRYGSIKRHLIVSMVSHLLLAEQHERMRGEKPIPHDLPDPNRARCAV